MNKFNYGSLSAGLLLVVSANVMAGPYGYDLHNVLAPVSAGMAGTSIAEPLDNVSAVFGNPAGLSEFRGTEFTFGATWYKDEAELSHDGSVTGTPFQQQNGNEGYIVPEVAVTQDLRGLGIPGTLGAGLTAVSGIGVEYRENLGSLGASAEFIIFGANLGLSYDLTPDLTIGGAMTISFGQLDLGLASTGAETHDVSWRTSLGLTYNLNDDTQLGLMYHSRLRHNFDDIVQVPDFQGAATGHFADLEIEQPMDIGIGISNRSLMGGDLYLAADLMWKNWDGSEFWKQAFDDQIVTSVGAELTRGKWHFRGGYGYAEDPTDTNFTYSPQLPNGLCAGLSVACAPINSPAAFQYLGAAQTQVIYEHRLTAGIGYDGFLAPFLSIDGHVGWQFEEERDYGTGTLAGGGHSAAKVSSWHTGFALTWNF